MTAPRVLVVSKAVVPPWNDGSKNLARDLATFVDPARARMSVFGVVGDDSPDLANANVLPVFGRAGKFAPGLREQVRAFSALVKHAHTHDILHFVFAPTQKTARAVRTLRPVLRMRGFRGRTIQTVASRPKHFDDAKQVLFADTVVVLSEWAARALVSQGVNASVIVPSAPAPVVSKERVLAMRAELSLEKRPIVLYPGDYEVSRGARSFADIVDAAISELPDHAFVFACRTKNEASRKVQAAIAQRFGAATARVKVLGNVTDMHALLAGSESVVFPVDDLYGKVDLPLVLLEALAVGVPMVVAGGGPLEEIKSARLVASAYDVAEFVRHVKELAKSPGARETEGARGREEHQWRFRPEVSAAAYMRLYAG